MRIYISKEKYLFLKSVKHTPKLPIDKRAKEVGVSSGIMRLWIKEMRDRELINASKEGRVNILSLTTKGLKFLERLEFFEKVDINAQVVI